jgi:mannose-6-phosphate isomerase-like protein (cupin superfamily)
LAVGCYTKFMTTAADLDRFLGALAGRLRQAATAVAAEPARALADFADRVAALPRTAPVAGEPESVLSVCRYWPAALDGLGADWARPLASLAPALRWAQNPNYRRHPPDPDFLANYGYAVIAGPAGGPPAPIRSETLALGVLLLGPGTHYPLHSHPATELYVTLSGDGQWWRDQGPWRTEPPDRVIHHASLVPHATRAGAHPLLAAYLWQGDLGRHARLVGAA